MFAETASSESQIRVVAQLKVSNFSINKIWSVVNLQYILQQCIYEHIL